MSLRSKHNAFLMWVGERSNRVRRNERAFRRHNRGREPTEQGVAAADELVPFVCECGDEGCRQAIELTIPEFERAHSTPDLFAVKPGHVLPEFEEVMVRNDRYWVARRVTRAEAVNRAVLISSSDGRPGG